MLQLQTHTLHQLEIRFNVPTPIVPQRGFDGDRESGSRLSGKFVLIGGVAYCALYLIIVSLPIAKFPNSCVDTFAPGRVK